MARGVNKVIIVGNLGQDPEVRYLPNGNAVANFTVATSESWTDQQGQKQERTEWHRIVVYRRLAEIAGEYLRKGSKVYLEGRLQTREWQDQQGQKRYTTEIVVNEMQLLDPPPQTGQSQGYAPPRQAPQGAPAQNYQAPQGRPPQGGQAPQQGQAWQAPQGRPPQGGQAPQGHSQQQGQAWQQQPAYNEPPMNFDDDIPF